jgi:cytochrome c-type biogenesis protein CcmH/NrfF
MRNEVTALVASGKSEQEIITYYRKKYVETILVVPDGLQGHLLTFLPLASSLVSAALLVIFIRKATSSRDKHKAQIALAGVADERSDLKQNPG